MNKKLACFLVALTATSSAYAHDCECEKHNKDNEKKEEKSGISIRTQNLISSLVKRGALVFDDEKGKIEIALEMIKDGESDDKIRKYTSLSQEQLERIKTKS